MAQERVPERELARAVARRRRSRDLLRGAVSQRQKFLRCAAHKQYRQHYLQEKDNISKLTSVPAPKTSLDPNTK
jgi:hypothetical protein